MPRKPPSSARIATCQNGGAIPHKNSAGIVKIVPVASDELADPIVCEMFASRIMPLRRLGISRNSATVSTAIGIDVDTVSPTFNPRYAFAAPKITPKKIPATTARVVNSMTDSFRAGAMLMREAWRARPRMSTLLADQQGHRRHEANRRRLWRGWG